MPTENIDRFPLIPYYAIRHHMGGTNVGVPDEDVRAEFECLCATAVREGGKIGCSAEETAETIRYALECHHENRCLYDDVVLGRIGRGP